MPNGILSLHHTRGILRGRAFVVITFESVTPIASKFFRGRPQGWRVRLHISPRGSNGFDIFLSLLFSGLAYFHPTPSVNKG